MRICVLATALLSSLAHAAPVTLRFATAAPEGTSWARQLHQMGREIADESHGEVLSKWYFGGIAGDEIQSFERLERGQLDVVMSGGMLCTRLSPSMRAIRLLGLFQSREDSSYVLGRLRPMVDAEFAQRGMHNMGEAGLGSDMVFSRRPVSTLADLRSLKLWVWDLDDTMRAQLVALGIKAVPLPLDQAARAFEEGKIDGFLAVPAAALAFQWSAKARYLSMLRLGFLPGCMVMSNRAWDQLSVGQRQALTVATAKFQSRLEELGRGQDELLLGGLFARQGVKQTPVTDSMMSEFFEAARQAREKLRDGLIPAKLMDQVTGWVADYRATYQRKK